MKNLRNSFERFCFRHRSKGIPNLMLFVGLGAALVYVLSLINNTSILYPLLCFDRTAILQGQVWRLFTYPLVYGLESYGSYDPISIVFFAVSLLCYFSLGKAMENAWGTLRFNLYYLTGMVLMDVFCLCFGGRASAMHLNTSLFLAFATTYPDAHFMLLYFIPVKAWIFALIDLGLMVYDVVMLSIIGLFPYNLFPIIALSNYFLFFGKDVLNIIPVSWRANLRRLFRKKPKAAKAKPIQFRTGNYQADTATVKAPYTHCCTICGRTDVSDPALEFRYCSRCSGYHCYCQDHISDHTHIQ